MTNEFFFIIYLCENNSHYNKIYFNNHKNLMKNLYQKAMDAYLEMFLLHIDTKTTDDGFHAASEWFYESLFDITHKIGERAVDLGDHFTTTSNEEKHKRALELMQNLLADIEGQIKSGGVTPGTKRLLASIANTLEDHIGSAKAFV